MRRGVHWGRVARQVGGVGRGRLLLGSATQKATTLPCVVQAIRVPPAARPAVRAPAALALGFTWHAAGACQASRMM